MERTTCPQCGGRLESRTLGEWHEKVLFCPYCSNRISVPGEVEIKRHEEETTPGGYRRVDVQVKRRDLGTDGPQTGGDLAQKIEELTKKAGLPAHGGAGAMATGGLPPEAQEALQRARAMARGKGVSPQDMERLLSRPLGCKANENTSKVVIEESFSTDGTGVPRGAASPAAPSGAAVTNPTDPVKWLVVLAVIVFVIVVLVKFF